MKKRCWHTMISSMLIFTLLFFTACIHEQSEREKESFTKKQTKALAKIILGKTPNYPNCGIHFTWVVLAHEVRKNPQALQIEVVKLLQEKYKVYFNPNSLPEELYVRYDENSRILGYKNGFSFSYYVEQKENGVIELSFSDWEGNVGSHETWGERYKWTGKEWQIIKEGHTSVS